MSDSNACLQPAGLQDQLWIIVKIEELCFAINALDVKDMIAMPSLTRLPERPAAVPGTINHRGQIVPLVDFRALLGKQSVQAEVEALCDLMTRREQDHCTWIEQLERSVKERSSFDLATDPHQCAFGKWYDAFETDDLVVAGMLRKFAAPHQAVHAIAARVKQFEEQAEFDAAYQLIEATRNRELAQMVKLFAEVRQVIRDQAKRQVALVLEQANAQVALSVDVVDSVEELSAETMTDAAKIFPEQWGNWVSAVGRRKKGDGLALVLGSEMFFNLTARVAD